MKVINSLELNGGGLLLYVNSNIPAKRIESNLILHDVEKIDIEINLWKGKWFICGTYNPQDSNIDHHLGQLGKLIDSNISKYENIILLGDFNCTESDSKMENYLYTYNLKNLVKTTCFKNVNHPSTIDLILTNKQKCFFNNDVMEIGLSDFHLMTLTILRCNYIKCKPKILTYRCFKHFDMAVFRQEITHAYSGVVNNNNDDNFEDKYYYPKQSCSI